MSRTPLIVGAGLAGLLAAHAWPGARLIEGAPGPRSVHKALLRFRSDAAAKLTGTEFKRVRVRKGVFSRGQFCAPNIALCNQYALKTIGVLRDRSIWNVDPVDRYVAPEDWYEQLLDAVCSRIDWDAPYQASPELPPVISTAPLPAIMRAHGMIVPDLRRSGIRVTRWRVPNAAVYQTIYFPDPTTSVYRASITGSLLIVEEALDMLPEFRVWEQLIEGAFGISMAEAERVDAADQSFGKVDELEPALRKSILFELTSKFNVYSLGRFATWRNILLDDVVDDIAVIKRLLNSESKYELRKQIST